MSTKKTPQISAEFLAYVAKLNGQPSSEEEEGDNLMSIDEDEEYKPVYEQFVTTGTVDRSVTENEDRFFQELVKPSEPKEGEYDDEHVYLDPTRRALIIKRWLVSHPILVIDLKEIIYLRPAPEVVLDSGAVKPWGIGDTGIGWARDGARKGASGEAWERSWVCKYTDERLGLRAGFSVQDPGKFEKAVERLAPGILGRRTYP